MKATVHAEITFDLATPNDYDETITSWEDAAEYDLQYLTITIGDNDVIFSTSSLQIEGKEEFERTDDDDDDDLDKF